MIYVYILLVLLCTLLKKPNILWIFVVIFLSYLVSVSSNVPDFSNYEYIYQHIIPTELFGMGKGWYFINNIGRQNNLTYLQFKTILILIGLTLLFLTFEYFAKNSSNYVWGMYLLYPAFLDIVQTRFFLAISISVFGLIFLTQKNIWGTIMFFCFVTVATCIHNSNAFYYLFLLIPVIEKNKKIFSRLIIFSTLLLIPLKNVLLSFISSFASLRQSYYFDNNSGIGIVLLYDVIMIIFFLLTDALNNQILASPEISKKEKSVSKLAMDINMILLLLIPSSIVASEFLRLQRIGWIFVYIQLAILVCHKKEIDIKGISINNRLFGFLLSLFGLIGLILITSPLAVTSFFS